MFKSSALRRLAREGYPCVVNEAKSANHPILDRFDVNGDLQDSEDYMREFGQIHPGYIHDGLLAIDLVIAKLANEAAELPSFTEPGLQEICEKLFTRLFTDNDINVILPSDFEEFISRTSNSTMEKNKARAVYTAQYHLYSALGAYCKWKIHRISTFNEMVALVKKLAVIQPPHFELRYTDETGNGLFKADYHAAGWDLPIANMVVIRPGEIKKISTGIRLEIPAHHYGLLLGRSSCFNRRLAVSPGVIDSNYRGEILICVRNTGPDVVVISPGDPCIGQVIIQRYAPAIVDPRKTLSTTERGNNGFGSSDVQPSTS
ncbi:hypothetical protein GE061_019043 [Apolygus lucorum]|uniref:Deoxyuridine 5'-triphosphate nucleotidohydrolase n=1 Tax=Apolygus lucorum TaxID=248454 RepID=A0A8S9X8L2_APOLU|nr:hypothetical protein GE061_019043 [Apolygus lucorum]